VNLLHGLSHMPIQFKLPELGENVTAGDVIRVLVKAGDTVAKDQPVLELETDKATIEVPSSVEGQVQEILVKPGDKVKVGQPILSVESGDAGASEPAESRGKEQAPPAKESERRVYEEAVPTGGLDQHTGASKRPAGAAADRQRARVERESGEGVAEQGASAPVPERGDQEPELPRQRRGEVVDIARGPRAVEPEPREVAPAAPSVRRLARELGVDIDEVHGTGPSNRISAEDVKNHARSIITNVTRPAAPGAAAEPLPDFARWGEIERLPMSGIRRKTAHHLTAAWREIPHVTQHDRADITELERLRARFAKLAEEAGGKLTLTAILLKVLAVALRRFPQFNASVDLETEEIVRKKYVHIGMAVDTERGLLVPVIRDVDTKGIVQLAVELAEVAQKAKDRKLSLEEMSGGSMTITNLGGIGGTYFSPIVNWPEVAILGVSRASMQPVFDNGAFAPRLLMPLSLSYDHRVIDGADAIRFLRWVVEALEQPFILSLQA
jgi:pyruvate dehydrogenase E2 component (dihydrolipoamide acetyltransferase)